MLELNFNISFNEQESNIEKPSCIGPGSFSSGERFTLSTSLILFELVLNDEISVTD